MMSDKQRYDSLKVGKNLFRLVKLEYAMKKHFVYMDNIDVLKHNERVIRDFDIAISLVENLINGIKRI